MQKQKIITKDKLFKTNAKNSSINAMSYNAVRDELFFAQNETSLVRSVRLHDDLTELREIYNKEAYGIVKSVCHMRDSDTLLVGFSEHLLVALGRNEKSEWIEKDRKELTEIVSISCTLSESQVLIGKHMSRYMELLRVKINQRNDHRIASLCRMAIKENYKWFSATQSSDTLVAMSYDNEVRVHRLRDDQLEELAHIQCQSPSLLLFLTDRILLTQEKQTSFRELTVSGKELKLVAQPIVPSDWIEVGRWCAVDDGLAIFDMKKKNVLRYDRDYKFATMDEKPYLHQRIVKQAFAKPGGGLPAIRQMSYNSARDELFLANFENNTVFAVRDMRLSNIYNPWDAREAYIVRDGLLRSVCHIRDSDTLLVCFHANQPYELGFLDRKPNWDKNCVLMALSRNGSEWREAHRVVTEAASKDDIIITCELSDSRVLMGERDSKYMELFSLEYGPKVIRVNSLNITDHYSCFSATTSGNDTLVAISYDLSSNEVRVYLLEYKRLKELVKVGIGQKTAHLLWLADRLLVAESHDRNSLVRKSHGGDRNLLLELMQLTVDLVSEETSEFTGTHLVKEFEFSLDKPSNKLEFKRILIKKDEEIRVGCWCGVCNGISLFDECSGDVLHYII